MSQSHATDVVIAGGGIIGLSIGLELLRRGLSVTVVERQRAMQGSSWAAGGMLGAHDPENPAALLSLSLRSLALYPAWLDGIVRSSGVAVPMRTARTLQQVADRDADFPWEAARASIPGLAASRKNFIWLEEESLDPRDLCRALPAAFVAETGTLLEGTAVLNVATSGSGVNISTASERIAAGAFINCCGAWAGERGLGGLPVDPVKGQAVTVALEPDRLRCVLRTPEFYAIPRGDGRVTIGATIEHVGFDRTVEKHRIAALLGAVSTLLPEIREAKQLACWAGLRPGTPDDLPILGAGEMEHCWHATGHYRNGILLAPVTARVLAQAIFGEATDVALEDFALSRFATVAGKSAAEQAAAVSSGA